MNDTLIDAGARTRRLRFACGTSEGPRGLVWSVEGHPSRGELYIGVRASTWKISLHETGDWRIAFVSEWSRDHREVPRVVQAWREPGDAAPGLIHGLTIGVPFEALAMPARLEERDVVWCSAPAAGELAWFGLLRGAPRGKINVTDDAAASGTSVVGRITWGQYPLIVTHKIDQQTAEECRIIKEIREGELACRSLSWWPMGERDETTPPGRRIVVAGETRAPSERASRHVMEIWIDGALDVIRAHLTD